MANSSHVINHSHLPWDAKQFRTSDLFFIGLAFVIIGFVVVVDVPKPVKHITPATFDRTIIVPPPIVEAPKPVAVVNQPEHTKAETTAVMPKSEFKPKLDVAKAIPKAAAPVKAAEMKLTSSPISNIAAATSNTIAKGTGNDNTAKSNRPLSEGSTGLATGSTSNIEANASEVKAQATRAARAKAEAAVFDTGLGNSVADLNTIDTGSVNAKNLQLNGRAASGAQTGDKVVLASGNGSGKGKKGAHGSATGISFSSATAGDLQAASANRSGKSGGSLSARSTANISGEITDKVKAHAAKSETKSENSSEVKAAGKRPDFNKVMEQAKGRVQSAFKRILDDDPTLAGNISVKVKIAADGHVTSATISSTDLNNSKLEGQIIAIVKDLNFANGNYEPFENTFKFNFVGQ